MDTFYVDGHYLFDTADNRMILRGINLPVLDNWGFPPDSRLAELEQSGANAVRLQWYAKYGSPTRPAYTLSDLDTLLDMCRVNRLIPILMLADCTCQADPGLVNTELVPWWTRRDVVEVLNKHKKYLIINLGNEVGNYRWTASPASALANFTNAYIAAINSIRTKELEMPVMVDAPDCGSTLGAFTSTSLGKDLIDNDPCRNVLLSAHAYWAGYDGMAELGTSAAATLPIVFGEVANKQDEEVDATDANGRRVRRTEFCYYDLDGTTEGHLPPTGFNYQTLLSTIGPMDIGWLAWSWWKDRCASREITSTGNYADLTPYGDDIVNNAVYGLRLGTYRAVRTPTLP